VTVISKISRLAVKYIPFLRMILNWLHRIIRSKKFRKEFSAFKRISSLQGDRRFEVSWQDRYPCLDDKVAIMGFDRHYIYHTAWAARIVAETKPFMHIDISSSLYFCSIISAIVPVKFYDYRSVDLRLDNLEAGLADLKQLPFPNQSVSSMSCMHVVEHIGLGRYGDTLDPLGDVKAITELIRCLAPGGSLLFVVPVGKQKLAFNAHRIYTYQQMITYFKPLELIEFALIPDNWAVGGLVRHADPAWVEQQFYGCGCFWFKRPLDNENKSMQRILPN
jgi:hypothetical protein